jgi:hypothetical protein
VQLTPFQSLVDERGVVMRPARAFQDETADGRPKIRLDLVRSRGASSHNGMALSEGREVDLHEDLLDNSQFPVIV